MTQLSDETVVGLLPCPFCATPIRDYEAGVNEYWILCPKCKASSVMAGKLSTAVSAWNLRAIQSGQEAEELREALVSAKSALESVFKNDKTIYDYHGEHAENRNGQKALGVGRRWFTPMEIAEQEIKLIDEALAHPSRKGDWETLKEKLKEKSMTASGVKFDASHTLGEIFELMDAIRGGEK